ncbi:flagellin N-terminal helical domain-containing protein [Phreatobacter sp. AB_2022a]|uniref:flagellin N-terminal helical domain-containing protein n=1 Tax=Phreatobacter sp. AB_2022a TaxID=3003134 RepID=UPI002286F04B|nr:flagellin [Phreatobacter sp. AB_2022a]MCZ0735566.1 flagellin [Phreatobacter sp. AB_2022a]
MASNITLSAGVRSNLLNLQNTADLKNITQTRLSTGKKVNSALDNPSNFFTAASLSSRASDLSNLLDGMANGIQTIQAANNGLSSITTTLQSMQSTLNQARQDKSFQTQSYTIDQNAIGGATVKNISLSGGAVGSTPVTIALNSAGTAAGAATYTAGAVGTANIDVSSNSISMTVNGKSITIDNAKLTAAGGTAGVGTLAQFATAINTELGASFGVTAAVDGAGKLAFTGTATGANASVTVSNVSETTSGTSNTGLGTGGSARGTDATGVKSVDTLVSEINANTSLAGKVTASNDNGKLRIQNLSTADLTVTGVSNGSADGSTSTGTVAGNSVRTSLAKQFNDLRDQLTKFGDDASFNGVNLLRGDNLKLTLNETGTSFINVQAKDKNGSATSIDNAFLKVDAVTAQNFDSDTTLDGKLDVIKDALSSIRSVSSSLGSQLSSVQARKDFTKQMINTLQVGSDNLTLADTNEEGANLLALNTRQSLQTTSLSFASQADQAVLQFLR